MIRPPDAEHGVLGLPPQVSRPQGASHPLPVGATSRAPHARQICGVCRPDDARFAADAGADAIGMVRVDGSPRQVSLAEARAIAAALPAFVTPVLLYLEPPADVVRRDLAELGCPAVVQFQGDIPVATMAALDTCRCSRPSGCLRMPGRVYSACARRSSRTWLAWCSKPQARLAAAGCATTGTRSTRLSTTRLCRPAPAHRRGRIDPRQRRRCDRRDPPLCRRCQQRRRGIHPAEVEGEDSRLHRQRPGSRRSALVGGGAGDDFQQLDLEHSAAPPGIASFPRSP